MAVRLKPLNEQVVVITGATSGIGLVTARMAAQRGAKVFLTSRNEEDLKKICNGIQSQGGECDYEVADVAQEGSLEKVARKCEQRFGGFDTWINNAGTSIFGRILETQNQDARKLFDTNFWGLVEGCRVAAAGLRKRGGAIINIGSVLSEFGYPMQGFYSATKHAVKGITDALRRELQAEKAPISVTLVKPGAIDTPYTLHAKNQMEGEPVHVAPVYAPEVAAKTILECATHPIREIGVGFSARVFPLLDRLSPRVQDFLMSRFYMENKQSKDKRADHNQEALSHPAPHEGRERGNYEGHVMESSLYTQTALLGARNRRFLGVGALAAMAGVVGYALTRRQSQPGHKST